MLVMNAGPDKRNQFSISVSKFRFNPFKVLKSSLYQQDKPEGMHFKIKQKFAMDQTKECSCTVFVYLSWIHSGHPDGLCTPCSHLAPPGWDRALRCYWAAALRDGHGLSLRAGRAWYSRSKSSSRSQHSPELDVGTHVMGESLLQDILWGSKQLRWNSGDAGPNI